jgi:hypothetical protein
VRGGCADGRARQGRESGGGGEGRGRAGGGIWPKGGGVGPLSLFFYSGIVFSFLFYFLYLIQIQVSHKSKLDFPRIMHQAKVKSRVQHDATTHTPLGFNLSNYNYK